MEHHHDNDSMVMRKSSFITNLIWPMALYMIIMLWVANCCCCCEGDACAKPGTEKHEKSHTGEETQQTEATPGKGHH